MGFSEEYLAGWTEAAREIAALIAFGFAEMPERRVRAAWSPRARGYESAWLAAIGQ